MHLHSSQYYISGTIVFLVMEMLANFGYYRYINKNGGGSGSMAFLFVGVFITLTFGIELTLSHSRCAQRRTKLAILLPFADRLDGTFGRHAFVGSDYE